MRLLTNYALQPIRLGFVVTLLFIAFGFALSFYSYNRYDQDNEQLEHSYQVISSMNELLSAMKDVETGARGYVASGNTVFLEPYYRARPSLPGRLRQLRRLVSDNPLQQTRVDSLDKLVAAKLIIVTQQIQNRDVEEAKQGYLWQGKIRMDRIRLNIATMLRTEHLLMNKHNQQVRRSFQACLLIVAALSVLTFISLILSYNLLEKELLRRQATEADLRTSEAELKDKIRQLEASNEELERFAFVASHDLQEPLRKTQAFGNLLVEKYKHTFDEEGIMYMQKIMQSAGRMSRLIKDLLNFSRLATRRDEFKTVALGNIIQDVLIDQELRIKGQQAQVNIGALPTIQAVPSELYQLFTNLVSNALKFTPGGTIPVISITTESVDGSYYPELIAGKRYYKIGVQDNGIGFDVKYVDHIFKVFQRLHGKNTYEGTGIGLAICKRVVLHHKGYITAHSQPGQGSLFTIILPETQTLDAYDRSSSDEARPYFIG